MSDANLYLLKQQSLINSKEIPPITIIGAGAIGSCAALSIAKMGPERIRIIDFDTVSEHNVGNQLFGPEHIEKSKTEAIVSLVQQTTGQVIEGIVGSYPDDLSKGPGILICCADSMDIRRQAKKEAMRNGTITHLIEARMGAKYLEVYTLPADKPLLDLYEKYTLSKSYEAAIVPHQGCVEPGIFYTAMIAGSFIAASVDRITRKIESPHLLQIDLDAMQIVPVTYKIENSLV